MDGTSNKYPLYSASLEGPTWDNGVRCEMVIIIKWSDRTASANKVGRKIFYLMPFGTIGNLIKDESFCEQIYDNYDSNQKLRLRISIDITKID